MSEARAHILATIRRALGRPAPSAEQAAALHRRLDAPEPNVIPARARINAAGRIGLFITEAERADATVARVATVTDVPRAVADYLAANNLPSVLKVAPAVAHIPWSERTALSAVAGVAGGDDPVGVTGAFAGVAETGTLVLLSGPDSPTTLNFLPDTHVVVLAAARIVGTYEDTWRSLRAAAGGDGPLPRTVNWITGPSRTADIEQTLLLGAHGPRRLHIVLVDGNDG